MATKFRAWGEVGDLPTILAGKGISKGCPEAEQEAIKNLELLMDGADREAARQEIRKHTLLKESADKEAARQAMGLAIKNLKLLKESVDRFGIAEHLQPAFQRLQIAASKVARGYDLACEFLWWAVLTHSPLDLHNKWPDLILRARVITPSMSEVGAGWRAEFMKHVPPLTGDSRMDRVSFPDELERWAEEWEKCGGAGSGKEVVAGEDSLYHLPDSISPDAFLAPRDMARTFGLPYEALKKRLERFRRKNHNGWIQNMDARNNEAGYTFQVSAVMPIIAAMRKKASRLMSRERPAR